MSISINDNTTDEEIVEYTRNHNKEYYSYIIDRYESKLLSYIKRLTYNSPDVEDLVQQVFVNVYVNLNKFNTDNKFSSWIYRIAHNQAINWLKKKKASISIDENEVLRGRIQSKVDILKDFEDKETGEVLTKAINKLPEKFKEPFILKYMEDRSYEEISYILRKPKNTIGTMISRAKIILRKELDKKL